MPEDESTHLIQARKAKMGQGIGDLYSINNSSNYTQCLTPDKFQKVMTQEKRRIWTDPEKIARVLIIISDISIFQQKDSKGVQYGDI